MSVIHIGSGPGQAFIKGAKKAGEVTGELVEGTGKGVGMFASRAGAGTAAVITGVGDGGGQIVGSTTRAGSYTVSKAIGGFFSGISSARKDEACAESIRGLTAPGVGKRTYKNRVKSMDTACSAATQAHCNLYADSYRVVDNMNMKGTDGIFGGKYKDPGVLLRQTAQHSRCINYTHPTKNAVE